MKEHGKPKEGAMTTTIDLDVTPTDQSGEIVICDLDPTPGGSGGGNVVDGVVFLSNPGTYQINFRLRNGTMGNYSWDADPFWARRAKCPKASGMPPQFPRCSANGNMLTVDANGVPGRSAVHFRLNMLDPGGNPVFCDPIIINT